MPELEVMIGGRSFQVSCQPGEEHFLRSAAALLDIEAAPLTAQLGRLPETKLLLMAGLMLADKTAAIEDEARTLRARVAELEARPAGAGAVAEIPRHVVEALAKLATRAEAMAEKAEEKA